MTFSASKWATISEQCKQELAEHISCSIRNLEELTGISTKLARKSIEFFCQGSVIPLYVERVHGLRGIGTFLELAPVYHVFLYNLYVKNPSRPLNGYVEELFREFRISVRSSFVKR